jgi:hypothetical protein
MDITAIQRSFRMFYYILADSEIGGFMPEGVPYGGPTTHLFSIGWERGKIIYSIREETNTCRTEEVSRFFDSLALRRSECCQAI